MFFTHFQWFSIFTIVISCLSTLVLTRFTIAWVKKTKLMDDPNSALERKYQKIPVPLLGGSPAVIVATIMMAMIWFSLKTNFLNLSVELNLNLQPFKIVYIIIAIIIMLIGGYLDDRYQMSPKLQILFILGSIALVVFGGGLVVDYTSFTGSLPYMVSILISFAWLGFCTASTKFLDGHDGLVTSVGIINFLTIASISFLPIINQPLIFLLTLVWACCLAMFAFWNFPNAKAYLGEGASEIIGFMIGVFSILSGAKVATSICILGWFILDIILVWFVRLSKGKNPLTSADRNHWHFRLLDIGFNKIQVLVFTWIILLVSSFVAIYGSTSLKVGYVFFEALFLICIFIISTSFKKR
jgi:UDP-GlcNAc:undecaprenyl-phosphate/decaprenyl-phosphate GlcNAc-1-phosphate transferase